MTINPEQIHFVPFCAIGDGKKSVLIDPFIEVSLLNHFLRCSGVCQLCQATDGRGRGRYVTQTNGRRKKRHQDCASQEENMKKSPVNVEGQM